MQHIIYAARLDIPSFFDLFHCDFSHLFCMSLFKSSAGRRPARHYPSIFLRSNDQVRALLRMRPAEQNSFFAFLKRQGFARAHDRSNNTRPKLFVRKNAVLAEFIFGLHKKYTAIDRVDAGFVLPVRPFYNPVYAGSGQLSEDEFHRRSYISDRRDFEFGRILSSFRGERVGYSPGFRHIPEDYVP